jgi:hypothetical protein
VNIMRLPTILICAALAGGAVGCAGATVSGQPAFTAGPSYVLTTAHDGSTFALDCNGEVRSERPPATQPC